MMQQWDQAEPKGFSSGVLLPEALIRAKLLQSVTAEV